MDIALNEELKAALRLHTGLTEVDGDTFEEAMAAMHEAFNIGWRRCWAQPE